MWLLWELPPRLEQSKRMKPGRGSLGLEERGVPTKFVVVVVGESWIVEFQLGKGSLLDLFWRVTYRDKIRLLFLLLLLLYIFYFF